MPIKIAGRARLVLRDADRAGRPEKEFALLSLLNSI